MDNQSSTGGSIVTVKKNGEDLVDEQIDERILRLLGLEYIFDIDYDTYTSLLKEKMVAARMAKTQIPTEEAELLTNEYKKIRGKKGRFKVKKITAQSLKKGSAVGVNLGKQKALVGKPQLALPPADKMTGGSDIKEIIDALAEIIKSLTGQNKLAKDSAEKSRIAGEVGQRGAKESRLEKGFKFAIKAAEKIIAPIKSLLDRIIDFFVAIFVGRALIKLLDWFSDSKNQDKIKAIGRFLGNQWPKLLALYLVFGNSFGRFALRLVGLVAKGAAGLLGKILLLNKAKKAQAAGRFLSGKGGKGVAGALATTALIGGTLALTQGLKGDDESIEKDTSEGKKQKTQGYSGGGFVMPKIPAFSGGGLNFKGMFGGASGSGKPQEMPNGFVSGEKGVDKVPALLTDGEFVMSVGAVQKYGVDTLEGMNAAGGGTNKPKMISGTTYAAGGGVIGGAAKPLSANAELAYDTMKLQFPTAKPYHIAGALANFETEAPGLKPNTYQIGGGPGRGIAQWETPGRWDTATKKYGPSIINSLPLQLSYVKHEMDTGNPDSEGRPQLPYGTKTKSTWLNSTNLIDATTNFMKAYEAPGIPHLDRRLANAKSIMTSINNSNTKVGSGKPKPTIKNQQNIFQKFGSAISSIISPPAQAKQPTKPKPMGDGGFLGTLDPRFLRKLGELGVPGTGSVMAPLSSGPKDIYGNQQTGAGYQRKLFGKNIGSPFGHQDGASGQYDSVEKSRYEKMSGRKFVPTHYGEFGNTEEGMHGLTKPTRSPKSITPTDSKKENDKLIGESFKNFRKNVQTIKGAAKKQEEILRELGVKPDGYVNMRGQKLNLGPQSNAMPIEPPSKSKVKVVYTTASGASPSVPSSGASPSVPSFSAVHPNSESRRRNAAVLGVA